MKADSANAKKAYQSILDKEYSKLEQDKLTGVLGSWASDYNLFYRYCDIDGNGVDELMMPHMPSSEKNIQETGVQCEIAVYTYYKGKEYLKQLGTNYVGFACTLEEKNGKVSGILLPYWL